MPVSIGAETEGAAPLGPTQKAPTSPLRPARPFAHPPHSKSNFNHQASQLQQIQHVDKHRSALSCSLSILSSSSQSINLSAISTNAAVSTSAALSPEPQPVFRRCRGPRVKLCPHSPFISVDLHSLRLTVPLGFCPIVLPFCYPLLRFFPSGARLERQADRPSSR
jgi:hypothetical protein